MNIEHSASLAPVPTIIHSIMAAAPATSNEPRLLYDRKEAARQLSVSVRTLDYFVANKQLSTRRIGKKVLIPRGELVRFARADHFGPVNISPDIVN